MKKIENDVARTLCTTENLPVALRIANELLASAMEAKNTKRVRELSALVDDLEAAINAAKAPTPSMAAQAATDKSAKK